MDWGLLLGVLGVALALIALPPESLPEWARSYALKGGWGLLALSLLMMAPFVYRIAKKISAAAFGPLPVFFVVEQAIEQKIIKREELTKFAGWIADGARAGHVDLYGEFGSRRRLEKIPAQHLAEFTLDLQGPYFTGQGNVSVRTYNPKRSLGDQDTDECFFNIHSSRNLMMKMLALKKADDRSPQSK